MMMVQPARNEQQLRNNASKSYGLYPVECIIQNGNHIFAQLYCLLCMDDRKLFVVTDSNAAVTSIAAQ